MIVGRCQLFFIVNLIPWRRACVGQAAEHDLSPVPVFLPDQEVDSFFGQFSIFSVIDSHQYDGGHSSKSKFRQSQFIALVEPGARRACRCERFASES
jgi:hypothetical protein